MRDHCPREVLAGPPHGGFSFPGCMSHDDANLDFTEATLRLFQPRANRRLTHEDTREITSNLVGFFNTLATWSNKAPGMTSRDNNDVRPSQHSRKE